MNAYNIVSESVVVQEGNKLKATLSGGYFANETKSMLIAQRILQTYPNPQQCAAALMKMANNIQNPKVKARVLKQVDDLKDISEEDYPEYVRKNLSGTSGFWKFIAYFLGGTVAASIIGMFLPSIVPLLGLGVLGTTMYRGYKHGKDSEAIMKGKFSADQLMRHNLKSNNPIRSFLT